MNEAITKKAESLRPRSFNPIYKKNKFVEATIAYYIDGLSRDKVLRITNHAVNIFVIATFTPCKTA